MIGQYRRYITQPMILNKIKNIKKTNKAIVYSFKKRRLKASVNDITFLDKYQNNLQFFGSGESCLFRERCVRG